MGKQSPSDGYSLFYLVLVIILDSHHGVFCLLRIGNQVMDTPSLVEVDRSTMDIIFIDTIIL